MPKPVSEQLSARELFTVARAIEDSVQREAYLNAQCKQDMQLRNMITGLLAADGKGVGEIPLDRIIDAFGQDRTVIGVDPEQVRTRPLSSAQ
jgi:hypothetical protein